jgi:hypothetical protein
MHTGGHGDATSGAGLGLCEECGSLFDVYCACDEVRLGSLEKRSGAHFGFMLIYAERTQRRDARAAVATQLIAPPCLACRA